MQAEIGLIGLGVMGANLALNIAEHGFPIAVYNRTAATTDAFVANAGGLRGNIVACKTIAEFAAAIRPPRPIIIMVKAGEAVDEQIALLKDVLGRDDIVIDAGNANFRDTVRREKAMAGTGLQFIDHGWRAGIILPAR
jgi:6-phosphogluconate dehydrogenase